MTIVGGYFVKFYLLPFLNMLGFWMNQVTRIIDIREGEKFVFQVCIQLLNLNVL